MFTHKRKIDNKVKFQVVLAFSVLGVLAIAGLILVGCGRQTAVTTPHGTITYHGTQSPGDVWSWTIGETSFIATNETKEITYQGTYTTLASGFLKWLVTDSTTAEAVGKVGYALEFLNTALLVKPLDSRLIVCAVKATTAPSAGQYKWVTIPPLGWTPTSPACGTAEGTESAGSYSFNVIMYDINKNFLATSTEAGYTFSDGRLIKSGSNLKIFMTPSGAFLADWGKNAGGIIGMKYQAVSSTEVARYEYRGALFKYDPTTGTGETEPIGAEPHPTLAGALKGFSYSDIDNNIKNTESVATLEFGAQDSSGILSGTLTDSDASYPFNMVAAQINNKYMIFGISMTANNRPYNFVAIQK